MYKQMCSRFNEILPHNGDSVVILGSNNERVREKCISGKILIFEV